MSAGLGSWGLLLLLLADPAVLDPLEGGNPATEAEFDSAVYIRAHHKNCSAVMLSPRVGLTAAHCLVDMKFGQEVTAIHGLSTLTGTSHQVSRWKTHPEYCADCDDDQLDLALIETTLPIESLASPAIPIVSQSDWDELMHRGQSLTLIGYGSDGTDDPVHERRRLTVTVDEQSPSGREFDAIEQGGRTHDGDSGSPLFGQLDSGELRLAGIYSRSFRGRRKEWGVAGTPYAALCWVRDETGLDVLEPEDEDCRLVDTHSSDCGGCRTDSDPKSSGILLILAVGTALRRRRPLR